MNRLYKGLAKVLWFFVKMIGQVVVFAVKLVAPAVARRLQKRLTETGRRVTGSGSRQDPALAER